MERINRILAMHCDLGNLTYEAIATAADVDNSTAGRWVRNGQTISFDAVQKLATRLPNPARGDVWDVAYRPMEPVSRDELDVNGDGVVDREDLLDAEAAMQRLSGEGAQIMRDATRDGVIDADEEVAILSHGNALMRQVRRVSGITRAVASNQATRRKARPFAAGRVR